MSTSMLWGQSSEAGALRAAAAGADRFAEGSDSDLQLISSFRAGSEAAFDRLFARYQEYVYNVCLGILGNPDDARDCTQETFLRVYRKVGEFRAEAAFSTWLYRITVNVCVGQLRRRPTQSPASLEEEHVREIAEDAPGIGSGLEREEQELLVRRIVSELPDDYRVVLVLRYFQELSYEEMMQILGYTLGQVKVKLHRARRAFARRWASQQPETVALG